MGIRFETWATRKEKMTPSHQNDKQDKTHRPPITSQSMVIIRLHILQGEGTTQ
jgi:hypothetical protein